MSSTPSETGTFSFCFYYFFPFLKHECNAYAHNKLEGFSRAGTGLLKR